MRLFYLFTITSFTFISCSKQEMVDLVIKNGIIYTVNDQQPSAQSVAIIGDKIIRSVKLNCDGALSSRGAWLLEPLTPIHSFMHPLAGRP